MTKWYENPVKAWQEDSERKRKHIEKTRPGDGPFLSYGTNEFFSTPLFKFLIIPQGYAGVRERVGRIGEVISYRTDPRGNETDEAGNRIEVTARDIPWGGVVNPGLRFMLGLNGLWSRMAVVDMRMKSEEIETKNVITEGGTVQLPKVVTLLNYNVADPVRAMTMAKNYAKLVTGTADVRIRDTFAPRTLEDIAHLKEEHRNLAPAADEEHARVLRKVGITMSGLYIADFDLPNELEKALAAQAVARETAQGRLEEAKMGVKIAEQDAMSGAFYSDPNAREAARIRAAVATSGVTYNASEARLAEAIAHAANKGAEAAASIADAMKSRKP